MRNRPPSPIHDTPHPARLSPAGRAGSLRSSIGRIESSHPGSDGGSAAAALTLGLTYVPDIQFAPAYVADKLAGSPRRACR